MAGLKSKYCMSEDAAICQVNTENVDTKSAALLRFFRQDPSLLGGAEDLPPMKQVHYCSAQLLLLHYPAGHVTTAAN